MPNPGVTNSALAATNHCKSLTQSVLKLNNTLLPFLTPPINLLVSGSALLETLLLATETRVLRPYHSIFDPRESLYGYQTGFRASLRRPQ